MNAPKRSTLLCLLAAAACQTGCLPPTPTFTASLRQLVSEHNANARWVPRLWARAAVEMRIVTDKGIIPFGSVSGPPNGLLLLDKGKGRFGPHNFVLIGKESGTRQEIFRLGNSLGDGVYYYWYHYGTRGGGAYARTRRGEASGIGGFPIDPLQLISVLSICELPDDFTRLPTVVMRMDESNPYKRAYVLTYIDGRPGEVPIGLRREIYFHWDDNKPRRPFKIKFLDGAQKTVMIAELSSYQLIETGDAPREATSPAMPTDIRISWPRTGSRLHIVLSELSTKQVDPEAFLLWDRLPAGLGRDRLTPVGPATAEEGHTK